MEPQPPLDPETSSILAQAVEKANRLEIKAETDGKKTEGEASITAGGPSWALKFWAKVLAQKGKKPNPGAGIEFSKQWLIDKEKEEEDEIIRQLFESSRFGAETIAAVVFLFVVLIGWLYFF